MLTKLTVCKFKRFEEFEIELGNPVVFTDPNNAGKTSAMQVLALWDTGIRLWNQRRTGNETPERQSGVGVNRRDLVSVPTSSASHLWRDLEVRNVHRVGGKQQTSGVRVASGVEGVYEDRAWMGGLEFDYANQESFYCHILVTGGGKQPDRTQVLKESGPIRVAFMHPMSGLVSNETRLDQGALAVRVSESRTAEIRLRDAEKAVEGVA